MDVSVHSRVDEVLPLNGEVSVCATAFQSSNRKYAANPLRRLHCLSSGFNERASVCLSGKNTRKFFTSRIYYHSR